MKYTKNINLIVLSILFIITFCVSSTSIANQFNLGISMGPAFGFQGDFNDENSQSAIHFKVGIDTLYYFSHVEGLAFEADFSYIFPATYNYGSTQIKSTGVIGDFSEKMSIYGGFVGLRKNFLFKKKLSPFIGLGLGIDFVKIADSSYTDTLGNPLPLSISDSGYHLTIDPSIGLQYRLSYKLLLDIALRPHIDSSFLDHSYFEIPLSIKYTF